jgi:hypothetical protein
MDEVKKNPEPARRGMMFSFAALLLCICIILFAAITAQWSVWDRQTASRLMDIDRANDIYSNAEDGLAGISLVATNMTTDGSTARVSASLPAPDVSLYLQRFAQFESNYTDSGFRFNATTAGLAARKFYVMPSNVQVWHQRDRLVITPQAASASGGEPTGYDVEAIFNADSADGASWTKLSLDSSAKKMPVHVRVRNDRYSMLFDFTESLNRSAQSMINITQAGQTVATISFGAPSTMEAWSQGGVDLKASIGFSIPIFIETGDTMSLVSSVNKTGRIRVGS